MALYSVCGINCETCRYFIQHICEGCSIQNSNLEAKCRIWICADEKGLKSCRNCGTFPCKVYSVGKQKSLALQVGREGRVDKFLRSSVIPILIGLYLTVAGFFLALAGTSQTLVGIPLIVLGSVLIIKHKKTKEIISEIISYFR